MKTSANGQKQSPEVFCKKGTLRNFAKFTGTHLCQSLFFNKVAGQAWLVHNMSLKAIKLDQGATEMFISEFENKESFINVMSEIYKNDDAKKASFKRLPELFEMSGN